MKVHNKFFRNKRADLISFNVVFHIVEIVFMVVVGIFVFFIIHVERNIDTFDVESEILLNRILYSNNGLWLYDGGIDRLYPGMLMFETFNDKQKIEDSLNKTIYYGIDNKRAAAQLILNVDGSRYGPVYYNEQKYREWVEWYKAGVTKGIGAAQGKNKNYYVLVKQGDKLVQGSLNVTVLIPNR